MAYMPCMPWLEYIDARSVTLTGEDIQALQNDERAQKIVYGFSVYGRNVTTLDTELNLDGVPISDPAQVETILQMMPNLQKLSLVGCGLSDEAMGALFDAHPQVKFIWEVSFGKYKLRTDATAFTTNLYAVNDYHYTSGTFAPRKSAGRVYCGYSSSPVEKLSSSGDSSDPSTPGTSRATASITTSAPSSPPVST
jgi:hypothetical protein